MAIFPLENEGPALLNIINAEPGGKTLTQEQLDAVNGTILTGADIKSKYEAEPDTNAFTDTEKAKLGGFSFTTPTDNALVAYDSLTAKWINQTAAEAGVATVTELGTKLDASAVSTFGSTLIDDPDAPTARTTLGLGTAAVAASTAFATAAQGATADTAVQPVDLETSAARTVTASTTVVSADAGKGIRANVGTANTVTFPTNAADPFPIDGTVFIAQFGAGATSIKAPLGVTLNGIDGGSFTFANRWDAASAQKTGTDAWVLYNTTVA